MEDHIYKKIEVVGSSKKSIDDAIHNAINRAAKSVRQMRWFEVAEIRGAIDAEKINQWQVAVKIGFAIDD